MNSRSQTTRRNIFLTRLFLAILLGSFILQILLILWGPGEPLEIFFEAFERWRSRARTRVP